MKRLQRYKLISVMAIAMTLTSCSMPKYATDNKTTKENRHHTVETSNPYSAHLSDWQKRVVKESKTWIGTPYQYGGATKGEGADCSGFVLRVYEKCEGWKLPRNSAKQAEYCKRIKEKDKRVGDLVFFATGKDKERVSHVGIIIDEENFIHATSSKGVVITPLSTPYWARTLLMYGRLPQIAH